VTLDSNSEYMQKVSSILKMKLALNTDDWMIWLPGFEARKSVEKLAGHLEEVVNPEMSHSFNLSSLSQAIFTIYAGALIQPEYAKIFKDLSEEEIDLVMQSFAFKNCKINEGLLNILKKHTNEKVQLGNG